MGVMDEPVEDGVGQGGIAQGLMPVRDRQLAGDDGGAGLVAFVQEFQQVAAAGIIEQGQPPVVEHQHLDLGQGRHQRDEAPVGVGDGEFLQQPRQALIACRVALPTRGIGQGTGQVGLADPGGAGDQYRLVATDPVAGE